MQPFVNDIIACKVHGCPTESRLVDAGIQQGCHIHHAKVVGVQVFTLQYTQRTCQGELPLLHILVHLSAECLWLQIALPVYDSGGALYMCQRYLAALGCGRDEVFPFEDIAAVVLAVVKYAQIAALLAYRLEPVIIILFLGAEWLCCTCQLHRVAAVVIVVDIDRIGSVLTK